jgi:hypothetical protein
MHAAKGKVRPTAKHMLFEMQQAYLVTFLWVLSGHKLENSMKYPFIL